MDPDDLVTLRVQYLVDSDPFNSFAMYPIPSRAPAFSFVSSAPVVTQLGALLRHLGAPQRLDDAALQVYKDGDYGAYLDLESSLAEQSEEIEGLNANRKNSLVVRTQLSVRVHSIIEKLLSSEGRELRRALFSLKQIFQEDKDLVHGFVALGGLICLVQIGNEADQNYQNYILRALGQVMLYVDGMNGVMKHAPTIQWLYSLIASKYRLVVKTALKLLLVFVEYCEGNCYLMVSAIRFIDTAHGVVPWNNIMRLLKDYENADTELLIYATSLVNKTLSGLSDQDSFYDESDFLEQQGMEGIIQRYMSRPGTDLDLLDQLQLYETVLRFEDGETDGIRIPDNTVRKTLRYRSNDTSDRRKSRRHSTGTAPVTAAQQPPPIPPPPPPHILYSLPPNMPPPPPPPIPPPVAPVTLYAPLRIPLQQTVDEDSSSSANSADHNLAGSGYRDDSRDTTGVTPGLRRRRERAERQKTFMREQQELSQFKAQEDTNGHVESDNEDKKLILQLKKDHTVKDLTQKLSSLPLSPQEDKPQNRIGDMSGLISKAKEGLAKSKSNKDISRSPSVDSDIKKLASEQKKSENELHWEEIVKNMTRKLNLCDLDFTDLTSDDDKDVLAPRGFGGAVPPPPPPGGMMPPVNVMPPPPSMMMRPPLTNLVPPMYPNGGLTNPAAMTNGDTSGMNTIKKNKKTVKLFWKEVREDMIPTTIQRTIWDELPEATVDTQKLEHLFESRAKDLMTKKQQELNKNKEIIVLDHKRSNAINIAMTKLPPPRAIKAAILKMDSTVVTREGIEKLLNMLPTDEERCKIQEAQMLNPELPLGTAEQFLLTLSSISELGARLKLWAFKLDFENIEKEIAEPLMDLKQGIELLKSNLTFKCILSTLLKIGIFLNGAPVKGFQIDYLAKVPEVKDTVHKHSLLHHLCHMVMETQANTTDLYSEIGPITRASKADFGELAHNVTYLETECKASWDRLKLISKHDTAPHLKQKLIDFLADCAERIIILSIVHRRVQNRYRKFLLWLGVPQHRISESRPNEFCRIVSEFALEYRTTRERVQQQIEKKANHRERNKTRGKLIVDVAKFKGTKEDRADVELRTLLGTPTKGPAGEEVEMSGTLTWRRRRGDATASPVTLMNSSGHSTLNSSFTGSNHNRDESFTDGDDEILESLVKTATKASTPRPAQRERKRTRQADRKSLRRTLKNGLTEEEKQHVASLIKGY
ncbi:FH1/FH2 domain-containing protein 3 isoform X6 [Topomyia yanbarensis]|uniref:FH1/FH2 domain-containing protein 3 isoform X6 n=1 Tax=Topomyia yanbarensis TaxID=2498891 RepID=UPI00273C025E|nr:FH1/FH2 domain-containing protein 3 isoform X6 [Topomyia yanbarensis]